MPEKTTLAERVRIIIAEIGVSSRQLSKDIGASHGFLDTIVAGRSTKPAAARLEALAERGGYNVEWVVSGRGPKKGSTVTVEEDPRYVALEAVKAMGRAKGFDAEFVRKFDAPLDADTQPDPDYLWALMKEAWRRYQQNLSAPVGDALADLDEPPVQPARKKR